MLLIRAIGSASGTAEYHTQGVDADLAQVLEGDLEATLDDANDDVNDNANLEKSTLSEQDQTLDPSLIDATAKAVADYYVGDDNPALEDGQRDLFDVLNGEEVLQEIIEPAPSLLESSPSIELQPSQLDPQLDGLLADEVAPNNALTSEAMPSELTPNELAPNELASNEVAPSEVTHNDIAHSDVHQREGQPGKNPSSEQHEVVGASSAVTPRDISALLADPSAIAGSYGMKLEWTGKLAQRLGLPTQVTREDLQALLQGKSPDGRQLVGNGGQGHTHNPGLEILLSADKSVSLASLLPGGDTRIGAVRALASEALFETVENHFGFQRVTKDGETTHRGGIEMLGARVRELTSRDGEPHEHVHMLVMNVTFDRVDNKYRALDNRELYTAQSLLERGYHGLEGRLIEGLGHSIVRASHDGLPTIDGISEQARQAFSSRHATIANHAAAQNPSQIKETGATSREARERSWNMTRQGKEKGMDGTRFKELQSQWGTLAKSLGLDVTKLLSCDGASHGLGDVGVPIKDITQLSVSSPIAGPLPLKEWAKQWPKQWVDRISRIMAPVLAKMGIGLDPAHSRAVIDEAAQRPQSDKASSIAGSDLSQQADRDMGRASAAVSLSLKHLEERSNLLTRNQVRSLALRASDDNVSLDVICGALKSYEFEGRLSERPDDATAVTPAQSSPGKRAMRTDKAMVLEASLIRALEAGRGKGQGQGQGKGKGEKEAAAMREAMATRLDGLALGHDQKAAALALIAPIDRIQSIRGLPGVGKTHTLGIARALLEEQGTKVLGLAPTRNAVNELATAAGLKDAQTVAAFVLKYEGLTKPGSRADGNTRAQWRNSALILDEASLLSTRDGVAVITIANKLGIGSIALVGDDKQHGAVAAGAPFALFRMAGIREVQISAILRQSDPIDRTMVADLHSGHAPKALASLAARNGLLEVPIEAVVSNVAHVWLSQTPDVRLRTGIAVTTHALGQAITADIRMGLKAEGKLDVTGPNSALTLNTLVRTKMMAGEVDLSFAYERGQTLVFGLDDKALNISAEDQLVITDLNQRTRTLTLARPSGERLVLHRSDRERLSGRFEVMTHRPVELAVGDAVQLQRTSRILDLNAGASGTLTAITNTHLTVTLDGKAHDIARDAPGLKFIDHGYARTTHRFQGSTMDNMILAMPSQGLSATSAAMLVGASRHRMGLLVVTDNVERLSAGLARDTTKQAHALSKAEIQAERVNGRNTEPNTGRGLAQFAMSVSEGKEQASAMSKSQALTQNASTDQQPSRATSIMSERRVVTEIASQQAIRELTLEATQQQQIVR
jgi:conjugative relaxase-like TrwC/TraI family protein